MSNGSKIQNINTKFQSINFDASMNGQLRYYEVLHPSYTCFHQDDKTMSNMWTEYDPNFEVFYHNYTADQMQYANNHGILAKPDMPPQNNCMIGM